MPQKAAGGLPHCRMSAESADVFSRQIQAHFECSFVLSPLRGVDLVTALATPLTYEGLIDDLIGIDNG